MSKEPRPHIAKSEQRGDWETPPKLFLSLNEEYGPFTMDAAASQGQFTAEYILSGGGCIAIETPDGKVHGARTGSVLFDAFEHQWHGRVFLNPPYGPNSLLTAFVAKASREVEFGHTELVCALLPSRTGVAWWQEYVIQEAVTRPPYLEPTSERWASLVRFLRGRVTFVGAKDCAPFPSAVVIWRR